VNHEGAPLQPGSSWSAALDTAAQTAQVLGLALGFGSPLIVAGLMFSGAIPAGQFWPLETTRQVGYLFTGLVLLAAAWSNWRSGQVLAGFKNLQAGQWAPVLLRETLIYAVLSELSCILGLVYWVVAGVTAARHAWGFVLLTPLLSLAIVPRKARWKQALEG